MIKDPCGNCGVAYGHQGSCPTIVKNARDKAKATEAWERGKDDAEKGNVASSEDQANEHYMLGRHYHELEIKGQIPKRRATPRRPMRIPHKSEPRMAAVTSIARDG